MLPLTLSMSLLGGECAGSRRRRQANSEGEGEASMRCAWRYSVGELPRLDAPIAALQV